MKSPLLILLIAALVSGCASTPPAAKTTPHIGMTKEEVIQNYGKPGRVTRTDEGEVWTYDNHALAAVPFNFGWRPKQHHFVFDASGRVLKFTVEDF